MILWEIQVIVLILEVHSVLLAVNNKMDQMIFAGSMIKLYTKLLTNQYLIHTDDTD